MDPITSNGTHWFPTAFKPGRLVLVDICGDFGAASVSPGYEAADSEFSPYLKADGTTAVSISSRGGFTARVARNGRIGVQVTDADGDTSIVLDVIPAVDMPAGA